MNEDTHQRSRSLTGVNCGQSLLSIGSN